MKDRESLSSNLLTTFNLHGLVLRNRFANGWELNPPADMKVWSAPTAQGYMDFPFHPSTSRA